MGSLFTHTLPNNTENYLHSTKLQNIIHYSHTFVINSNICKKLITVTVKICYQRNGCYKNNRLNDDDELLG